MAQYYKVVSQSDENSQEIRQLFRNDDNGQTVQYLINPEPGTPQQFHSQQVVVTTSGEQLMVVEAQPQQVIVDQTYHQTAQTPQFIFQESPGNSIEFQGNTTTRQVYYMASSPRGQQIMIEQSQQPLVLNHQMMQNSPGGAKVATTSSQLRTPQQNALPRVLQSHQRSRVALPQGGIAGASNFPRKSNILEKAMKGERQDLISLANGSVMTVEQYRKIMAQQKIPQSPPALALNSSNMKKPKVYNANATRAKFPQRQKSNSSDENEQLPKQQQFQNQYIIRPPNPQHDRAERAQKPLPAFLHASQIQHILEASCSDEYSDSIRMLVLLENGEQRLITFTLPKEACTIQEILEQVSVPFQPDTPIRVTEANTNGLNYIVTVGHVSGVAAEQSANDAPEQQQNEIEVMNESLTPPTPELPKLVPSMVPPKLIPGKLAVCAICGYLSEDFYRCTRCKRKLPETVKAISSAYNNPNIKRVGLTIGKSNGIPKLNLLNRKRPVKTKMTDHLMEAVVISSDDEGDEKDALTAQVTTQIMEKLGTSVTIRPICKEPSMLDIQKSNIMTTIRADTKLEIDKIIQTMIHCRTVRIGSYKFIPPEPVSISSLAISIKVPHPKQETNIKLIKIHHSDIVKVLVSYHKSLPVIFFYILTNAAGVVRATLEMTHGSELYFDPLSETEAFRRITLLPELITEESRTAIKQIFSKPQLILDDLTYKEANDILIKTCPNDVGKQINNYSSSGIYNMSEVKQLMMYPPQGLGRISINTEDYICLGQDQFLNDVIIDFYLKYLVLNLPKQQQEKVHVFSTFFYKRLTTKPLKASRKSQPTELDPDLSAAQKRHARVKTWTKTVNVFEKDFVIIPINENCHWFLAIICFPGINGTQTMEGQSIKIEPKSSKKRKAQLDSSKEQVATVKEKTEPITCEDGELSDKDEAEGDDSELDSDETEEAEETPTLSVENSKRPPIKQPCILIFDSLAGASRSRVVATLRDYLTCEYRAKMNADKIFTKDVIKGACPKVPQQTNFTDCGLYLLQYVESFFNDPIKDYYIPITQLKNWFEEIVVTRKREDLSDLIKSLMSKNGKDLALIPEVKFPTQNGEIIERPLESEDHFVDPDEADDEVMDEEEDEDYIPQGTSSKITNVVSEASETVQSSPIKPSSVSGNVGGDFIEQAMFEVSPLKPDVSELKSKKETLSYLKSKRIERLKKPAGTTSAIPDPEPEDEGPDLKKAKTVEAVI